MQAALLWYETFSCCLKANGFKLNKYDPCVANKIIDGKQCTICWHVDDSKISHADPKVVDSVIKMIESEFGEMTVTRGNKHNYVGMNFELMKDGTVDIDMNDYVEECIKAFGEDELKTTPTPASINLFKVNEEHERLDKVKDEAFHHIVAKLLYVSKRARPDISTAIAFLCTRVTKSTTQDWEKLKRLLGYLKGTIHLKRTIGTNGLDTMRTYVDGSYAVHMDMKGHTGGLISLGKGIVHSKSTKQKLNTKSSTETELVGASDYIPWTLWSKRFLECQGYKMTRNIFYQDNESAIKMEKNGLKSCGEKSRHINIRYFFIKDILENENIDVKHCGTELMIADFLTKPLQGMVFKRMRDIIMGVTPFPVEERVGEYTNNTDKKLIATKNTETHHINDI